MLNLERNVQDAILKQLDRAGYIFPGFRLNNENESLKSLGKGGFSDVYEMRDELNAEKNYALKVIGFGKHTVTSEQFWETIRLQRQLYSQSEHVVRVLAAREILILLDNEGRVVDVVESKDKRWEEEGVHLQFVLMEKLSVVIQKDRYRHVELQRENMHAEREVINLALQVGQALQLAHKNNVLHRDIKLENIFWDEKSGIYKLGDFGIAKYVEGGRAETIVYTDGYGAPEIELHWGDSYNATADIYSFGIVLYLLLNDLKFPGSDGYYSNLVQYNPEFIFPAPVNASSEMSQIIRKMCRYESEERYQSLGEVLGEIRALGNDEGATNNELSLDLEELETETYREQKVEKKERKVTRRKTREERKRDEKIKRKIYFEDSIKYGIGLIIFLVFIMVGIQKDSSFIQHWQFWTLPIIILIESILMGMKEFHLIGGLVTMGCLIYSIYSLGITFPHIFMLMGLFVNIPVVVGGTAVATGLWMLWGHFDELQWLSFFQTHDLNWILVAIMLIVIHQLVWTEYLYRDYSEIRMEIIDFFLPRLMVVVGTILIFMQALGVIAISDIIRELHLVRNGMIYCVFQKIEDYLLYEGTLNDTDGDEQTNDV